MTITKVDITIDVGGTFWCPDRDTKVLFKTRIENLLELDKNGVFAALYPYFKYRVV